jgi:hypothetical protein
MGRAPALIAAILGLAAAAPAAADSHFLDSPAPLWAPTVRADSDPSHPFQPPLYAAGQGQVRWTGEGVRVGANDTVRLSVGEVQAAPVTSALRQGPYRQDSFDLSYSRAWPDALQFSGRGYDVAVSPHAGLGFGNRGGSAEAGAMLRLEPGKGEVDRLRDLGVQDGAEFGDAGRWYLFAAASGRAVGLNMTRTEDGGWGQSGWSTDKTSKLIGDGQLGVGFRKGAMQAAFGYVYREIKVQNGPLGADNDVSDSMAAFSLSIRP